MAFVKLPFLVLSAIAYHVALINPTSRESHDKVMGTSVLERVWVHAAIPASVLVRGVTWVAAFAESTVILSSLWDTSARSDVFAGILSALGPADASRLTVPFIVGTLLIIVGGIIRVACFRTLGSYFTFQQILRKDHKLVTSGPYAVVRHPGYTSLLMCIFGSFIEYGSSESWLRLSGVLKIPWVNTVLSFWGVIMAASVVTLIRRSSEEDAFLAERFGKEWEGWAGRVKYRLIPFVY